MLQTTAQQDAEVKLLEEIELKTLLGDEGRWCWSVEGVNSGVSA